MNPCKRVPSSSRVALVAAILCVAVFPAWAQVATEFGAVTYLETGWAQDTMAIRHSATLVNPDNCRVTNAGYVTDPADPGHSLHHTVALAAFLNHKEVVLVVKGCVFEKPKVIGVGVK
jgi:hypothetical protein